MSTPAPSQLIEAREKGLPRYFTGEPCIRGHVSERLVNGNVCLACARWRESEKRRKNPEKVREHSREYRKSRGESHRIVKRIAAARYRKKNLSKIKEKRTQYYLSNRDAIRDRLRKYSKANPGLNAAEATLRRANKKNATPVWVDIERLKEVYKRRDRLRKCLGLEMHVDHIVPLQSKYVCGLHVPWNLRIVGAKTNLRKNNRIWPDMTDWSS